MSVCLGECVVSLPGCSIFVYSVWGEGECVYSVCLCVDVGYLSVRVFCVSLMVCIVLCVGMFVACVCMGVYGCVLSLCV